MQKMFAVNEYALKEINRYLSAGWAVKTGGSFIPGTFVTLTLDIEELASLRLTCSRCKHKNCEPCAIKERMRTIEACIVESGVDREEAKSTAFFNPADYPEGVQL